MKPGFAVRIVALGLAVFAMAGLSLALVFAPSFAQDIRFFRIGTGSTAGANFPIGGLIASVLSNPPGSRDCGRGGSCGVPGMIAVAQATQGSAENAREVGGGRLDAAIIQADTAALAYDGRGEFAKNRQQSLRVLASLYPEVVQIVVRKDAKVTSLAGLKGKRISLDTPQSGTQAAARTVLAQGGIRLADIKPVYVEVGAATDLMREGKIDGFFYVGGTPAPAIAQLADVLDITLVPLPAALIEKIRKAESYYFPGTINAGAYKGVAETPTIAAYALFTVNESLSADLAYNILKSLWHKSARTMLGGGHPQGKMIRQENALNGLTIPLHPGAQRYYFEIGMLKDSQPISPQSAGEKPPRADQGRRGTQ